MSKPVIECPDTGDDRDECGCSKCSEYRVTWAEFLRDEEDKDWNRRAASRRYDRDQWCRINGRCW
jgi:hypothetical protein